MNKTLQFISLILLLSIVACTPSMEKSDRLVDEGLRMVEFAKNHEAIVLFTEAIDVYPDNFEAYYHRANSHMNLRDYPEAIKDYSLAIAVNPSYANAFANRAEAKMYLKDKEGACEDWRQAMKFGKPNMEDKLRHCD